MKKLFLLLILIPNFVFGFWSSLELKKYLDVNINDK